MTTTAGVVTVIAVAIAVAALIALHLLPTGLSPLKNAVSQYGITRFRMGYRIQTIGFAVAGCAAAVGIAHLGSGADNANRGDADGVVALLAIFAAARLLISWFPMDEPGAPRSSHGARHGLLAIVAFIAITLAAAQFGRFVSGTSGADSISTAVGSVSTAFAWVLVASLVAMMLMRRTGSGRDYFGAVERLFYVATTGWFVTVGVALLTAHT